MSRFADVVDQTLEVAVVPSFTRIGYDVRSRLEHWTPLTEYDLTDRVVVISTAHGLKFVEMKVKYHQRELEFPSRHANEPIELPARLDAVKEALHKALESKSQFRL